LTLLVAANQQQDDSGTVFSEVNPVARTEVDSKFVNSLTDWPAITKVSSNKTIKSNANDRAAFRVT
jgi:hypothetical protein